MTRDWAAWRQAAVSHLAPTARPRALAPDLRRPLDPAELARRLASSGVDWVLVGSCVLVLHGARLEPGDLDVVPDRDPANLARLARLLDSLGAVPAHVPGWEHTLTVAECRRWTPRTAAVTNLDHQFVTAHGLLDIVPLLTGAYESLVRGSVALDAWGTRVRAADAVAIATDIATRTRAKDPARRAEAERILRVVRPDADRMQRR
ncbi:hypothetical protein BH23ACT8_BH23ACT8_20930 [soil metagenome]